MAYARQTSIHLDTNVDHTWPIFLFSQELGSVGKAESTRYRPDQNRMDRAKYSNYGWF